MSKPVSLFDRLTNRNNLRGGEWLFLSMISLIGAVLLGVLFFSENFYLIAGGSIAFYLLSALIVSHFLFWGYRKKESLEFPVLRYPRSVYVSFYFLLLTPAGWFLLLVARDINLFLLVFLFMSIAYNLLVDLLRTQNHYAGRLGPALYRGFFWPFPYAVWLFFFFVLTSSSLPQG